MIPLIITGASGRMGRELVLQAAANKQVKLVGTTEQANSPAVGQDAGSVAGIARVNVPITASLKEALHSKEAKANRQTQPVIIDFTSPEATVEHLLEAAQAKALLVIGTTGFNPGQLEIIQKSSKRIPIVMAPNMSVGVNTMFKLVKDAVLALGVGYDLEVLEAHHRMKKDAPSGTAVRIAQILAEASGRKYPDDANFHREGLAGPRKSEEIGMQVIRGGDIVGEHTVFYCGDGERLEIRHVATHRKTFAQGAIRAAIWLSRQKPGLYDMQDVLGFK